MSEIQVNSVSSKSGGVVNLPNGMSGDANSLKFNPKIIQYSPEGLTVGAAITTNITITFDQNIEFSNPSGTIELRSGSATGTVEESFTTGSSPQVTISGNTLTINPSSDLGGSTKHYVILPSVGIANTYGKLFAGSNDYNFTTETVTFSATGGQTWTRTDSNSPTGSYKYHVFTATGPLSIGSPVGSATGFKLLMLGGGGGGSSYPNSNFAGGGGGAGGYIERDSLILDRGEYTVTIGGGGNGESPTQNPFAQRGGDTSLSTPTGTNILVAKGGGGGFHAAPGNPNPEGDGGSGGGNGHLGPGPGPGSTGGNGYSGQGHDGAGWGSNGQSPYGYLAAGGGGGGSTEGMTYTTHAAPPSPTGLGIRSGPGGSGRAVPEFRSPYIPPTQGIPAPSLSKIGSQGLYGGGGGGGAGPWPSLPAHPFTAGAGGPGGGGHGAYVDPTYSPFSPSMPTDTQAESGYQNTGGGGGGNRGPYNAYQGGNGGSGVVLIRYSV